VKRIAFALLLLPVIAGPAAAQNGPPARWFRCEKNEECIFAKGFCTENMVINRQYEKQYNELEKKNANLQCPTYIKRLPEAKPECVGGYCAIRLPYVLNKEKE
jgi:hypothetical protein